MWLPSPSALSTTPAPAMCRAVVLPDGTWLYSPAELVERGCTIPPGAVDEGYMEACFCCSDPEAILQASGWEWEDCPVGSGDLLVRAD